MKGLYYVLAFYLLFAKGGKAEKPKTKGMNNPSLVLKQIIEVYGRSVAEDIERIFVVETAHFTSGGFVKTNGAGMERHAKDFPYGWVVCRSLWTLHPELAPIGMYTTPENKTGKTKTFLKFADLKAGMFALAEYLKKYPAARWYSTNPEAQKTYATALAKITPHLTNAIA